MANQSHPDPTLRATILKHAYEIKRDLIRQAGEVLGPAADAHRLTAREEEYAWDEPDHQQISLAQNAWKEEIDAARQKFPDLTLEELIEEARPHVGARLFPFRTQIIGSAGRVDVRDQAEAANKIRDRAVRKRDQQPEYDQAEQAETPPPTVIEPTGNGTAY